MKKLKLLLICVVISGASYSQIAPTFTTITDTLHYYFNKEYFKTGKTLKTFPFLKAQAMSTMVTHCGSMFENSDALVITGLEAYVAKPGGPFARPVHLYLCTLNIQNLPQFDPVDSVITYIGSNEFTKVGGPLIHGNYTVTSNFAVLMRNMSTIAGDTILFMRTSGKTFTSTANSSEKFSDGYGYLRFGGNFFRTTNFTADGFGPGTDYEFCIAPRVEYSIQASQVLPQEIINGDTICTFKPLIFKNTSSGRYIHRQYNLNEFNLHWKPLVQAPPGGWTDAPITWKFEPEDAIDGRRSLGKGGAGTNSVLNELIFSTDSVNDDGTCFTANEFRARLHPMSMYGRIPQYVYNENFTICTKYCNGTTLSISGYENDNLKIYPNPASDVINFSGLNSETVISIYNVLGEKVLTKSIKQNSTIDITTLTPGIYLLKVGGIDDRSVKLIISQ
jgi:hypothetical protein